MSKVSRLRRKVKSLEELLTEWMDETSWLKGYRCLEAMRTKTKEALSERLQGSG